MNDIQMELAQLREKGWTLLAVASSLGVPYGTVKKWSAGIRYPANAPIVKAALKRLLEGKPRLRPRARRNPQPDIASLSFEERLALAYKYMGAFRHLATGRRIVDELSDDRIREAKQERREVERYAKND